MEDVQASNEILQQPITTSTHTERLRQAIQQQEPVLMQVGLLGAQYEDWVNKPIAGQPRFFCSRLAEGISKTPWWVVPLLWIPLCCVLVAHAALRLGLPAVHLCGLLGAGFLLWQLFEYSIHRFLFHALPTGYWAITLHFTFHGCHHKFPLDQQRLVFPPLPAAVVTAGVFWGFTSLLGQVHGVPLATGMLAGYTAYDCIHHSIHHRVPATGWMKRIRDSHLSHHFRDPGAHFGISSPLVDVLYGTI